MAKHTPGKFNPQQTTNKQKQRHIGDGCNRPRSKALLLVGFPREQGIFPRKGWSSILRRVWSNKRGPLV